MATMQYLRYPVIGTGSGSVTSVGLSLPGSVFTVTGSPVTTSGTLTATFAPQSANTVFAGPANGGPGTPAFRALVVADIPSLGYVTSVTASAPLISSGGTTPNISTTVGNFTDAGTDGITVTGGTGAVFGSGTSISQHVADATHNGYLSSADWSTFNGKQPAFTPGNLTAGGPDGISIGGPVLGVGSTVNSGGATVTQQKSDATHSGYLSLTDWGTFNGKQAAGNYITALTGDVTATGPGSVAATLANVGTAGTYVKVTTNAKGLVTSGSASPLTVPDGGTGLSTLTANNVILGNGASPPTFVAPSTSGNVLTSNGTTWTSAAPGSSGFASPTTYTLTPTATTTDPTKGTASVDTAWYTVSGKMMKLSWTYKQTAAGTAGSGVYRFPLPGGFSIDTSFVTPMTINPQLATVIGTGTTSVSGANVSKVFITAYDANNLVMTFGAEGTAVTDIASGAYDLSNTNQTYMIDSFFPIV